MPFGAGRPPWVLRVGVRGVGVDRWLDLDDDVAAALTVKRATLADHFDYVVAVLAGSEAAGDDVRGEVVRTVLEHGGGRWRQAGDVVTAPDGVAVDLTVGHGVDVAGRLVPDDILVMTGEDNRLVAACVTTPNRWRLAEKMGAPLTAAHGPVPGYAQVLAGPVDRLIDRLRPDRPVERRNWSLTDDPALFRPDGSPPMTLTPSVVGDRLWLRIERESLRRLPRSGAVVFTIRTRVWPLASLAEPSGIPTAAALRTALQALPADLADYKGLSTYREPVLAWLRSLQISVPQDRGAGFDLDGRQRTEVTRSTSPAKTVGDDAS